MLLLSGVASSWAYDDPMTHYTDPIEEAFNGAKFTRLWLTHDVYEHPDYTMTGYGVDDHFVINNNWEGKLMYHGQNDWQGEYDMGRQRYGMGISHDDAGNHIFRLRRYLYNLQNRLPEFLLVSADGTQQVEITLPQSILPNTKSGKVGTLQYLGNATGNVFSPEGGRLVFTASKESPEDGLYVLQFRNGALVEEESFRAGFQKVGGGVDSETDNINFSTETYIHGWHAADGTVHYLYITRRVNPIDMVLDEENHMFYGTVIDVERLMPDGYVRGQSNGFNMFSMGGRNYMVYPAVPNYLDGFHVAEVNVQDGTIVHKAYHSNGYENFAENNPVIYQFEANGNNWLNGEVINDSTAYIYQFFPWGYMAKYQFVDPIKDTPLVYIVNDGEQDNTYTIADDIIAVYIAEKEPTRLYAKDLGRHRFPSVKGADEIDYVKDRARLQTDVWDQSNWVLLDFNTEEEAREFLRLSKGVIKGGTLTGKLTNKLNPTMTVTSYQLPEQWTGYVENKHVTANYMDPLVQTGKSGGKYFFVEPKAQEYVMIYWAKYDGHESYHFRVPDSQQNSNTDQLAGGFTVNWSLYPGNYLEDFIEGNTYNFHAIIRYTADHHGVLGGGDLPSGAPLRDGEGVREGDYIVYPLEGGDDAITAVQELFSDLEPVEVTYVNMMGMRSTQPFDGVNIVVTRYNNGMTQVRKVIN